MAVNYQETDTAATCGLAIRKATSGGAAGSTPVAVNITSSGVGISVGLIEIDPALTSYAAGNYVVRVNITTANMNLTIKSVLVQQMNSTCGTVKSTIGTLSGLSQSLGATGVLSFTVSGSAVSPLSSDIILISCTIDNAAMSVQSFSWTPDQLVDTPLSDGTVTVNLTGQSATASVGTITPSYNTTVSLTGRSATASVGTVTPAVVVNATVNLTGQSATASVGTVTETFSGQKTLTGQSATASVGTVTPSLQVPLAGQSMTASVGTVTPTIATDATVNLTGQAMTASTGTVSVVVPVPGPTVYYQGAGHPGKHLRRRKRRDLFDAIEATLRESVYGPDEPAPELKPAVREAVSQLEQISQGNADLLDRLAVLKAELADYRKIQAEKEKLKRLELIRQQEDDDEEAWLMVA